MNLENNHPSEPLTEAQYNADATSQKLDASLSHKQLPAAARQALAARIFAATVAQLPLRANAVRTMRDWKVQTWFGAVPMRALAAMVCIGMGLTWWGLVDPINSLSGHPTSLIVSQRATASKITKSGLSYDLRKISSQLRELTSAPTRFTEMDQELISLNQQFTQTSANVGIWESATSAIDQDLSALNAAGID